MQKQKSEIELPLIVVMIMIALFILSISMSLTFGLQNSRHKETIEIYEEYYALDEEMDLMYRIWSDWYSQYEEEEYYLKYHPEIYLRYLELKEIIGEIKE